MKILLIGGSKGLGAEVAERLSHHDLVTMSRSSIPALDLEWPEEKIRAAVKDAITRLGGLDALIVSSGLGAYHKPTISDEQVKRIYQVNVFGPMTVFRAAQRALLRSKGKAVFITSTASRRPGSGGLSVYGSSKAAVNSWVQSEGRRQAKHGIAMYAVSPGFFDSPMTVDMMPALREKVEKAIPFGRFGGADEISLFVGMLIEQSNWVLAGQVFECSGGA